MPLNDDAIAAITTAREERGLSLRALARKTGRSHNWLGMKLRGESELNLDDVETIAAALEVRAVDLLFPDMLALRHGEHVTVE